MKILSFRPSTKNLIGGHRPYNIDKALREEGADVDIIEGWIPARMRPSIMKTLYGTQQKKRRILKDFVKDHKRDGIFLIHGVYPKNLMKKLSKTGLPIVLDFRDDPVLQAEMIGISIDKKKAVDNINYALEMSDTVLFPSEGLKSIHECKCNRAVVVMNASDPEHFPYRSPPLNHKAVSFTAPIPCYLFKELIEAGARVSGSIPDFKLFLTEWQSDQKGLNVEYLDMIKEMRTSFLEFLPVTPYKEFPRLLSGFQLNIISMQPSKYANLALPLKLFDTMASGQGLIVTKCEEMEKLVNKEKCGLIPNPAVDSIAEAIENLAEDSKKIVELSKNGRRAIEERHSWKHRARQILEEVGK